VWFVPFIRVTSIALHYFVYVFCVLVVLDRLSVPVQVTSLERLISEITHNMLMGMLNPTHSLTIIWLTLEARWHIG